MSTGSTTNFQIPLFGDTDFVTPIQTPLNSQSNALETALTKSAYLPYATRAAMNAAPGTIQGQHATVNADTTASNNGDYVWMPGSPGSWVPASTALPALFVAHISGTPAVGGAYSLMTSWGTPDFNTNFSFASGVLTVNQAGIYDVAGQFSTATNGVQSFLISKNSTVVGTGTIVAGAQSGFTAYSSAPVALAAGDLLRMYVAGPSSTTVSSANPSFMSVSFKSIR